MQPYLGIAKGEVMDLIPTVSEETKSQDSPS
jgi:hypothetical protein